MKKQGTLYKVKPEDISRNPHNPRLIFDPEDLEELKQSIKQVGILVPLTIYRNKKKSAETPYILLDGERRWRCAKEIGLKSIPANIIDEPTDVTQNILFMFNIHHFRREWELFPTALKLEVLMKELGSSTESTVSQFTGVSRTMIRRCRILLWYPVKYRNVLLEKSGKLSTDFFIELYPLAYRLSQAESYYFRNGIELFIDGCIEKFLSRKVTDVKEFREMRKCMAYYEDKDRFTEFEKRVKTFLEKKDISLEIFSVPEVEEDRNRKNILRYVSYLNENLGEIDTGFISDVYFVDQLKELNKTIGKVIEKIE